MMGNSYYASGVIGYYKWKTDTIFVIRNNYNLLGKTINIPTGCTLIFDGGVIKNGTVIGQDTKVSYEGNFDDVMKATAAGTWIGIENTKAKRFGTTSERPTSELSSTYDIGYMYFDTTLGRPIWWDGTDWIDVDRSTPSGDSNIAYDVVNVVNQ